MSNLLPLGAQPNLNPVSATGDTLPRIEWVSGNWCVAFLADEEEEGSITFTLDDDLVQGNASLNFSVVGSFGQSIRVMLTPAAGGAPFFSQVFTSQPGSPVSVPVDAGDAGPTRMTVTGLGGSPTRLKNIDLSQ